MRRWVLTGAAIGAAYYLATGPAVLNLESQADTGALGAAAFIAVRGAIGAAGGAFWGWVAFRLAHLYRR